MSLLTLLILEDDELDLLWQHNLAEIARQANRPGLTMDIQAWRRIRGKLMVYIERNDRLVEAFLAKPGRQV